MRARERTDCTGSCELPMIELSESSPYGFLQSNRALRLRAYLGGTCKPSS